MAGQFDARFGERRHRIPPHVVCHLRGGAWGDFFLLFFFASIWLFALVWLGTCLHFLCLTLARVFLT